MKEISNKIDGPYIVSEDTILTGMVTQTLTIKRGITFELRGMVLGDVVAHIGSIVDIYGMVRGTVINMGSKVTIYGMAGGVDDRDQDNGRTFVVSGAVVKSSR